MAFDAGAVVGRAVMDATAWKAGAATIQKTNASTAKTMAVLSKAALIASAAIAAGLVVSIAKANEFEKAFSNVTTLVDESVVDVQSMKSELLGLDSRLGSATDLTVGLYQALSASVEPAKAVEFVATSAEFAKAALVDTNTAVDVITTGLNAYGLAADNAADVSDKLFTVIKLGKVTGEELSATIGQSIPLAANMGIVFAELGASMAVMTRQGIKASQATTQWNAIVNALLKPSADMKKTLDELGFATGEAALEALGFKGTLDLLVKSTGGSKEEMAKLFANTRALRGIMALTGEGAKDFDDILKQIENSTGATNEAFGKQELTFETLANTTEKLGIQIGQVLLPIVFEMVEGVTAAVEWFSSLDTGTQELIVTVAALTAVVIPAAIAIGKMVSLFGAGPVGIVIAAIGLLAGAIVLLAEATTTLTTNLEQQILANDQLSINVNKLAEEYKTLEAKIEKTADEEFRLKNLEKDLLKIMPELNKELDNKAGFIDALTTAEKNYNLQLASNNIEISQQLITVKAREEFALIKIRNAETEALLQQNHELANMQAILENEIKVGGSLVFAMTQRIEEKERDIIVTEDGITAVNHQIAVIKESIKEQEENIRLYRLEKSAILGHTGALANDTAATLDNTDGLEDNTDVLDDQITTLKEYGLELDKEWTRTDKLTRAIRESNDATNDWSNNVGIAHDNFAALHNVIGDVGSQVESLSALTAESFGDAFRQTLEQNLLMPFDNLGFALVEGTDALDALKIGFLDFTKTLVSKVAELLLVAGLEAIIAGAIPLGVGLIAASALVAIGGGAISAVSSSLRSEGVGTAAAGGNKRGLTVVGERGPELINLGTTSRVFPANETRGMMGGINIGSMVTVNGNIEKDVDLERLMIRAGKRVQSELRSI